MKHIVLNGYVVICRTTISSFPQKTFYNIIKS